MDITYTATALAWVEEWLLCRPIAATDSARVCGIIGGGGHAIVVCAQYSLQQTVTWRPGRRLWEVGILVRCHGRFDDEQVREAVGTSCLATDG